MNEDPFVVGLAIVDELDAIVQKNMKAPHADLMWRASQWLEQLIYENKELKSQFKKPVKKKSKKIRKK